MTEKSESMIKEFSEKAEKLESYINRHIDLNLAIIIVVLSLMLISFAHLVVVMERYDSLRLKLSSRRKEYDDLHDKIVYFETKKKSIQRNGSEIYYRNVYKGRYAKGGGIQWNDSAYALMHNRNEINLIATKSLKDKNLSSNDRLILVCTAMTKTKDGWKLILEDPYSQVVTHPINDDNINKTILGKLVIVQALSEPNTKNIRILSLHNTTCDIYCTKRSDIIESTLQSTYNYHYNMA